jgi:histidinol-phosphate phosphatase family protein
LPNLASPSAGDSVLTARLNELTAFVLAGGMGTRLRSVVGDRQKVIAEVAGRPFIIQLLSMIEAAGIRRVVIGTGFSADAVKSAIGQKYGSLAIEYSHEDSPLGTAGALRQALPLLVGSPILVMNGDSYVGVSLERFLKWHLARKAVASLVLSSVNDPTRYGSVSVDAEGRVLAFQEKRPTVEVEASPPQPLVNAGVYLIERSAIERIPTGVPVSLEREVFPSLVGPGLFGFRTVSPLIDIGTPESLNSAEHFFTVAGTNKKFAILDRDGTLIEDPNTVPDPNAIRLLPGVVSGLRGLQQRGWALIVVSNQSAIGRGRLTRESVDAFNSRLVSVLEAQGVHIAGIYVCPHKPEDGCLCRKPAPGLVTEAANALGLDLSNSVSIGDKACDLELGRVIGARTVFVTTGEGTTQTAQAHAPDFIVDSLENVAALLDGPVQSY